MNLDSRFLLTTTTASTSSEGTHPTHTAVQEACQKEACRIDDASTFYDVLDIPSTTSRDDESISRAYKRLSQLLLHTAHRHLIRGTASSLASVNRSGGVTTRTTVVGDISSRVVAGTGMSRSDRTNNRALALVKLAYDCLRDDKRRREYHQLTFYGNHTHNTTDEADERAAAEVPIPGARAAFIKYFKFTPRDASSCVDIRRDTLAKFMRILSALPPPDTDRQATEVTTVAPCPPSVSTIVQEEEESGIPAARDKNNGGTIEKERTKSSDESIPSSAEVAALEEKVDDAKRRTQCFDDTKSAALVSKVDKLKQEVETSRRSAADETATTIDSSDEYNNIDGNSNGSSGMSRTLSQLREERLQNTVNDNMEATRAGYRSYFSRQCLLRPPSAASQEVAQSVVTTTNTTATRTVVSGRSASNEEKGARRKVEDGGGDEEGEGRYKCHVCNTREVYFYGRTCEDCTQQHQSDLATVNRCMTVGCRKEVLETSQIKVEEKTRRKEGRGIGAERSSSTTSLVVKSAIATEVNDHFVANIPIPGRGVVTPRSVSETIVVGEPSRGTSTSTSTSSRSNSGSSLSKVLAPSSSPSTDVATTSKAPPPTDYTAYKCGTCQVKGKQRCAVPGCPFETFHPMTSLYCGYHEAKCRHVGLIDPGASHYSRPKVPKPPSSPSATSLVSAPQEEETAPPTSSSNTIRRSYRSSRGEAAATAAADEQDPVAPQKYETAAAMMIDDESYLLSSRQIEKKSNPHQGTSVFPGAAAATLQKQASSSSSIASSTFSSSSPLMRSEKDQMMRKSSSSYRNASSAFPFDKMSPNGNDWIDRVPDGLLYNNRIHHYV